MQQIYKSEDGTEMKLGECTLESVVENMVCGRRDGIEFLHLSNKLYKQRQAQFVTLKEQKHIRDN